MQITVVVGFGLRSNGYSMCVYSAAYITGVQRVERPCMVLRFEIQEISLASWRDSNKIRVGCVLIFETVITVSEYQCCRLTFCFHLHDTNKHEYSTSIFPRNDGRNRSTATVDKATYTKAHINSFKTFCLRLTQKADCIPSSPCCEIHIYNLHESVECKQ
jgi:hypothetical protein